MKIDLAEQAKRAGKKSGTIIQLPKIVPTSSQTKELARLYMSVVNVWQKGITETIIPEYSHTVQQQRVMDTASDVNFAIEQTDAGALNAIVRFRRGFTGWMTNLEAWHFSQFINKLKYRSNVDLSTQMGPEDVAETMSDILERNVALIRNISDQERGRISDIVFRGLQNRTPVRDVAKEISAATGMARRRALNVASDQTVKLSAALDKQRQLQVGMTKFRWIHSGKEHYREEHLERDGEIFDWNSGVGASDPPGQAPFCGCKSEGILEI